MPIDLLVREENDQVRWVKVAVMKEHGNTFPDDKNYAWSRKTALILSPVTPFTSTFYYGSMNFTLIGTQLTSKPFQPFFDS